MLSICTLLIEENSFFREGIKSLLAQSDYNVATELESVRGIDDLKSDIDYELIIHGTDNICDGEDDDKYCIELLKNKYPNARIVILADELNSKVIKRSFSAGSDGLILKDISAQAFIGSLNLILMGEKVFPTSMASLINEGWNGLVKPASSENEASDYNLSFREIEVIKCLADGATNKTIARELNVTESTVKVHLKTILRKLGLSNRTQAAIWAVSNGIVPCPEIIAFKKDRAEQLAGNMY